MKGCRIMLGGIDDGAPFMSVSAEHFLSGHQVCPDTGICPSLISNTTIATIICATDTTGTTANTNTGTSNRTTSTTISIILIAMIIGNATLALLLRQ